MDQRAHFNKIREIYAGKMDAIIREYPRRDTHFYDFYSMMTPIERLVWIDIKNIGFPMYPQFPAAGFMLDFADPVKKIAIEADGKEFHDKAKDMDRDDALRAMGWTVYRFSGGMISARSTSSDELHPLEVALMEIQKEHYSS